jgi:hypothetical protein
VRRIGVLMNGRPTETVPQALRQPGWTEGQNLRIDMPNSRASMRRS